MLALRLLIFVLCGKTKQFKKWTTHQFLQMIQSYLEY